MILSIVKNVGFGTLWAIQRAISIGALLRVMLNKMRLYIFTDKVIKWLAITLRGIK
jgi:hypothetical protein